jgi:hypothetical protein
MLDGLQQAAHQPAENLPCSPCVCIPAQKGPAFDEKSATNECLNNVQLLVPIQPENGNPQRTHRCKHYIINGPAFNRAKLNPSAASNMLIFGQNNDKL